MTRNYDEQDNVDARHSTIFMCTLNAATVCKSNIPITYLPSDKNRTEKRDRARKRARMMRKSPQQR